MSVMERPVEVDETREIPAVDHARQAVILTAAALLADVRRRHPGEELRCPFMAALDAALRNYEAEERGA